MKSIVKKAIRDEKGAALVLALVLLLVGGLIIAPLLGFMGTGLIAGQVHEKRMDELYAADAGVEDAIWKIQNPDVAGLPPIPCGDSPWEVPFECEIFGVSGKEVQVYIEYRGGRIYRITSTATTDSNSSTTVVADYWALSFLDNAITSRRDVTIQPNSEVYGDVQYGGTLDEKGDIHGEVINEEFTAWPSGDELYDYYYSKYVENEGDFEYHSGTDQILLVSDNPAIGPLHWTGNLDINNTIKGATLRLDGTVYVNGDLNFPQPGNKDYTVDLNGQTILVEGSINFPSDSVSITGSGNIIAVGTIDFQPNMTGSDGFVLVLSLEGDVNFQPGGEFTGFIMSAEGQVDFKPNGDFWGSVAGDVIVDLLPNITLTWQSILDADIDFPFTDYSVWRIQNWNISLQTEAE